jgi:hypothetical protein
LQLLIQELIFHKDDRVDIVLDKVSLSDYFAGSAFLVIKEAEGPNLLNSWAYGRKDVTNESEAGSVELIPKESNFRSNLQAKGFTDDEIVALASVEAFGVVWDPIKKDTSKYPKLDNYYYKQISTGKNVVLSGPLTKDQDLKTIVEKYAADEKAYHEAFGRAFLKLVNLGHEDEQLTNVEHLLVDHPHHHFFTSYY